MAKAVSLETLVQNASALPEEIVADLAEEIAPVFTNLDRETQVILLQYRWTPLAKPVMLPVLRKIWETPPAGDRRLHEIALSRMYELSREETSHLIRGEIGASRPRAGISALGILPQESLPELEPVIATNLERAFGRDFEATSIHAALLERYGTRESLTRIQALFQDRVGSLECELQTSLLAYVLRVDPQLGLDLLQRAMQERSSTACYRDQLSAIWKVRPLPDAEKAAVVHLEDSEEDVRVDAVKTLGRSLSPGTEPVLWEIFEKRPSEDGSPGDYSRIEQALVEALSLSPAWLLNEAKAERLWTGCITENCRSSAKNILQLWTAPLRIGVSHGLEPGVFFRVAQYDRLQLRHLKDKLKQFPPNTVFIWDPFDSGKLVEEMDQTYPEVEAFLAGLGMQLERSPGANSN